MPDHYLAINSDGVEETITGIETIEPTFGCPPCESPRNSAKRPSFGLYDHRPASVIPPI